MTHFKTYTSLESHYQPTHAILWNRNIISASQHQTYCSWITKEESQTKFSCRNSLMRGHPNEAEYHIKDNNFDTKDELNFQHFIISIIMPPM